ALTTLVKYGISSVDSASYLRRAWMRNDKNYLVEEGAYTAIRIPEIKENAKSFAKLEAKGLDPVHAKQLEQTALTILWEYAAQSIHLDSALNAVMEYNIYINPKQNKQADAYHQTLLARPWEHCTCG